MIWVLIYFMIGALLSMLVDAMLDKSKIQDKDARAAKVLVDILVICIWPAFLIVFVKTIIESINSKEESEDT